MSEEKWTVIFSEQISPAPESDHSTKESQSQKTNGIPSKRIKESKPQEKEGIWANVGKGIAQGAGFGFAFKGIAGIVEILKNSKILSTFGNAVVTLLSTVIDILFLPLVPILIPALNLMIKVFPPLLTAAKAISNVVNALLEFFGIKPKPADEPYSQTHQLPMIYKPSPFSTPEKGNWWQGFIDYFDSQDSVSAGSFSSTVQDYIKRNPSSNIAYQSGTPYVPETGMYMLHRGERVVPTNQNVSNNNSKAVNITNTFNISGDSSMMVKKLSLSLEEQLRNSVLRIW